MPWTRDRTVRWAALFGVLPDLLSMGIPFLMFAANGASGHGLRDFFHGLDGPTLIGYRLAHSLLTALLVSAVLRLARRPLFIPSLAWTLHLLMDALSHGLGKYQTTLFYPLTDWALDGIRWWMHPGLVLAYWAALPAIWTALHLVRDRKAEN
jgi:hypothetical protein